MKILIVEDGLPMAMGAQMILKANGHDADVAMTPTEAKQAVAKTDYEAIFMDFYSVLQVLILFWSQGTVTIFMNTKTATIYSYGSPPPPT